VESFKKLENDMDARVHHAKQDQNGEVAALIKVVTTETGFAWDGGSLGIVDAVRKTGEYWVYVPRSAQRITISHDKLGVLRNYAYPVPIEAATVYEMRLTTARIETMIIEPEVETQWLVIESDPSKADVYIDNIHKGQTPVQIEMNTGSYSYRIEKPLYHAYAGRVELSSDERETISATLNPNFGFIKINTTPESGAEVTINGNRQSQTTPFTTDRFVSGTYQLTLSKPLYHTETIEVKVKDGETTEVNVNLRANFGTVTINTKPETDAEVLVNDINTGKKTPCDLERLPTGQHQITVRKEWYQPKTIAVNITDGLSDHFEIEMEPTFGVLNVTAGHEAEIFIGDDRKAKSQWEGRLIAGWYTIEARKDKYHTDQKRVEIKLGETQNLSLHPKPKTGTLKIQTTPYDAEITLNGKSYGKTPATIKDLLIGNYELILTLRDHAIQEHKISITENETEEKTVTMSRTVSVSIASNPSGADIFIEGQKMGVTPASIPVAIGKQSVTLKLLPEYLEQTNTIIVTNDNKSFSFDLKPDPNSIEQKRMFINTIYNISSNNSDPLIGASIIGKNDTKTIKFILFDNNLAIVTPPLFAKGFVIFQEPRYNTSLSSGTFGFSILGEAIVSPKDFLLLDVFSLSFGYFAASKSHKTRFNWEIGASINWQFALKQPDKDYVRVNLREIENGGDKGGVKWSWVPFFTEANLEFFLGKKSFLILTGGAKWAPGREWYLKSDVDDYKNNGLPKPNPYDKPDLISPFIEGIVPYFGIGLRF
jgi:hypothetical protein